MTLYEREDELVGIVGGHLLAALSVGGTAVAVVTARHEAALSKWLADHGVEVAGRRQDGSLVLLDADRTLDRIAGPDGIDPAAFDDVAERTIRTARPPRHVYGEMVDLLWARRRVTDVLALERLWDGLCQRTEMSLLCGYSAGVSDDPEFFADISRLHGTAFHDSVSSTATFRADPNAPAGARRFVRAVLHGWGRHDLVPDAELVVSELASNAVIHARSGFTVAVDRADHLIRVAVTDDQPRLISPSAEGSQPVDGHRHGLGIVAFIAGRWGADEGADGKVVWAELGGS